MTRNQDPTFYHETSDANGHGLEIICEEPAWQTMASDRQTDLAAIIGKAGLLALNHAATKPQAPRLAVIVLSNDANIQNLNNTYRGKNKPTNVLSFPSQESADDPIDREKYERQTQENEPCHVGDVILAYETVKSEAKRDNKDWEAHISHLIVHGVLHLLGYDHEDEQQASLMETLETKLMSELNYQDPYN